MRFIWHGNLFLALSRRRLELIFTFQDGFPVFGDIFHTGTAADDIHLGISGSLNVALDLGIAYSIDEYVYMAAIGAWARFLSSVIFESI